MSDKAMLQAAKLLIGDSAAANDLLTREEAAKRLSVGVSTIDRLVKKGRLRSVRIPSPSGGRATVRYRVDELNRFVEQHQA
jgi:excisionase family DNA binding protein